MSLQVKKLLKGILLFSIFQVTNHFISGTDGMNRIKKKFIEWLSFMSGDVVDIIANLIFTGVDLFLVYCFVSGLYRIVTFNMRIREFER